MSVSGNGIVGPPISIAEMKTVLGATSSTYNDLGNLCTYGNINKWAKHKPVRYEKITPLTEAEFKETKYGFSTNSSSSYDGLKQYSASDIQIVNYKYILIDKGPEYVRPTSYFRLTDFNGYCHNAPPPVNIEYRQDDEKYEWCYKDGMYFTDGVGRNLLVTNDSNYINFSTGLHSTNNNYGDVSVDFSEMVGNSLKEYSIGVIWIKSDSSATPQYLIMNTGIKLSEANESVSNSIVSGGKTIFNAYSGGGHLSIMFTQEAFVYEGTSNWLNGYNGQFYSKLLLVPSNGSNSPVYNVRYGINKTITVAECYSLDVSNEPGFFISKGVVNSGIVHTLYYNSIQTNLKMYKYKGSSISSFDTINYDYYRLTKYYSSSEQYPDESASTLYAIPASSTNMGSVTYDSGPATGNVTPPISYSLDVYLLFETTGECGFIKRSGNTFTFTYGNKYDLRKGSVPIYPNKTASQSTSGSGSGVQNVYSYIPQADQSYDEIWFRCAKGSLQRSLLVLSSTTKLEQSINLVS